MGDHQWPTNVHRYPFQALYDHPTSLNADFDNTVEASWTRASELPSTFQDDIAKGVTNDIIEAQAAEYVVRWSVADKDRLIKIILNNVRSKTPKSAQNTVPLAQFYELQQSYYEVQTRCNALLLATATHVHPHSIEDNALSNVAVADSTRIIKDNSYSATICVKIVHQMSVNRMQGWDSHGLGMAISDLIKAYFSVEIFSGLVRLSAARLLDSENVNVVAHAEHREDLARLVRTAAWHGSFERSLGPLPSQTYDVRMHNVRVSSMVIENRKQKSATIRTLADTNFSTVSQPSKCGLIRNISWCGHHSGKKKRKATCGLMVEFLSPEQANKALNDGLYWQGTRHGCDIADQLRFGLQRCRNCQGYGHLLETCSAKPQCGKCAGPHSTHICTSDRVTCALCGGSHASAGRGCLVHRRTKKKHRFLTTYSPQLIDSVSEIQGAPKKEPQHLQPTSDRTHHGDSIPRTLLQDSQHLRFVRPEIANLRTHSPIRHKRGADDALAESGRDTKRSKRDHLKQNYSKIENCKQNALKQKILKQEKDAYPEESMGAWRQPSPFIIHRPY